MDNEVRFVGLPFDNDRKPSGADDVRKVVEALEREGFRTAPVAEDGSGRSLEAWRDGDDGLGASVTLADDWMLHIVADPAQLDPDSSAGRANLAALADLIGAAAGAADTYIGFVSNDPADDLTFVVEDRPVRVENPLALVYLGRRYRSDWPDDEPAFATGAELDTTRPDGRLIVPSATALVGGP